MEINRCNQEIYENGQVVAIFDAGSIAMEGIVNEANLSGIIMDWHYFGGRAVVRTLGNVDKAKLALNKAIPRMMSL